MSYAEQHIFLKTSPLTTAERELADSLSSHAVVGADYAVYTYHFGGSFRGNEEQLLAEVFDAMLYQSRSGVHRLRFSLPGDSVDAKQLATYQYNQAYPIIDLTLPRVGGKLLFTVDVEEPDAGDKWLEDNAADLRAFLPLRNDLLAGDYRFPYLIWCYNYSMDEEEKAEGMYIPHAPPGLGELPEYLEGACQEFGFTPADFLTEELLAESGFMTDYSHNLDFLSQAEMRHFLVQFISEKPGALGGLLRRLREFDAE